MYSVNRQIRKNESGNVAVIAALTMVPILALVGMAVDLQTANSKRQFVQYVLDSAVIAGSREMQDGKSLQQIQTYINTYVSSAIKTHSGGLTCGSVSTTLAAGSQDLDASIKCAQTTTLTAMLGKQSLDFSVSSGSTYGIGLVDVAFVFDVSGSMDDNGKMEALKDAAEDAVDVLLPTTGTTATEGDVRIAMVSYSSMMNAGDYFQDVTNIDPVRTHVGTGGQWVQVCTKYNKKGKCKKYTTQWVSGTVTSSITNTCIKERIGAEAFTDEDPGPSAWFVPATVNYNESKKQWDAESCNDAEPLPLTYDRSDLIDYIDALEPEGGTAGHIGVAWGWYAIAPKWDSVWPSGSDPLAYDEPDSAKVIILMTDGEFNTWHNSGQGSSFDQAKKMCDNIKAKDVRIYTVAFNAPTAGKEILAYCASGEEFAFTPDNAQQLTDAYKTIAKSISDLRIRF